MKSLKLVRALMFFAAVTTAMAGGAAQAAVKSQVVDLTGIQSYDEVGTPGNTVVVLDLGANATVNTISWDFTFTAYQPSWLADFEIHFTSSDFSEGVTFTPSTTWDSGTESHAGSADLGDLALTFNVGADGKLHIEFAEGWKDMPAGVADGQWDSGTLTIGYDDHIAAVPEPETYAMLLLGLGAVGAIARRRRQV